MERDEAGVLLVKICAGYIAFVFVMQLVWAKVVEKGK